MQQQARQQLGLTPTLLCWGVFCTLTSRRGREDERASSLTACFDVNYTSVSVSCARFSAASPPRALNQSQQQTVSSEPRPSQDSREYLAGDGGWLEAWRGRRELPRCYCATHFLLNTIAIRFRNFKKQTIAGFWAVHIWTRPTVLHCQAPLSTRL